MKPGQLETAIKTELGHINTMFYWFINLKMKVDYKTTLIYGQPILDCIVPVKEYVSLLIGHIRTMVQFEMLELDSS